MNKVAKTWLVIIGMAFIVTRIYSIAINKSDSLEHKVFLVIKGNHPDNIGEYLVFHAQNNKRYREPFIKKVGGMRGDVITVEGRDYFINGKYIGTAREKDRDGRIVQMSEAGKIEGCKYFVYTESEGSYDSKYKEIGLVDCSDVIGTAYAIY